jgi:hypothetical protein
MSRRRSRPRRRPRKGEPRSPSAARRRRARPPGVAISSSASPRRWSSKQPPARSCGLSPARQATRSLCSTPSWPAPPGCAMPSSPRWRASGTGCCTWPPSTTCQPRKRRRFKPVPAATPAKLRHGPGLRGPPARALQRRPGRAGLRRAVARGAPAGGPLPDFLGVTILRDGIPVGVIGCARRVVKPFTATQIELVKTFAAQAVIAIENVRLFKELETRNRELTETLDWALEQQTATSEVLKVISRSTFDLQPVLESMVESATRLCGASRGHVFRFDGEFLRFAAAYSARPRFREYLERTPVRRGQATSWRDSIESRHRGVAWRSGSGSASPPGR